MVDPDNSFLNEIVKHVPIDMIQLQGSESPNRVLNVKDLTGLPVMKAIGIEKSEDLKISDMYAAVADQLLIDAKQPAESMLPGGNGHAFDWRLISGKKWDIPWMLAGGLTPENVAQAIKTTNTSQIDVSSGVEKAPGQKELDKITTFIQNAKKDQ